MKQTKRIVQLIQEEPFTEESVRDTPFFFLGKHRLVELLVREAHLENSYPGVKFYALLLSKLREKFWFINGRRTVRREINKCLRYKRYISRNIETPTASLPQDRVEKFAAFEVSGVDLAESLTLKGGEKCWIALFTCEVYSAVHLELVLSLTTRSFLLGYRWLIARRGRPKVMYSDNGTNFMGTENLLQKLDWDEIEKKTSVQRITWKFIPPSAPCLRQHLRGRSCREYLDILLQPRKKSTYYGVKPGEIVIIEGDSKKRLLWYMAKVLEVYPGKDNTDRVVRLKTQSGEIVRPVRGIYPLEIKCADDESHSSGKPLTIRSGRTVQVPSRFLRT
ncbi:zinc finger protein GIS2 [Trichonephila clavata]|uniref:Zinc finger protein GIS2 n=1 Tax=Trichonephila clavata TaxID=2740835 RepID=A0A8X6KX21_TRICU|nr:zinc finger protein GIS2 [Trichonephila clavata]